MSNRNNARRKAAAQAPADSASIPSQMKDSNPLLNFSVPTEIIELPSRGLFYPSGHPLHNKDTIEIRYMTAKDEDILTSPALLRKGIALERMLQNIIIENDIDTEDLLIGDRNALLVAARVTGYGKIYPAMVTCGSCGENFENEFDLSTFQENYSFVDAEDSPFNFTSNGTIEIYLPKTGFIVEVKPLSGRDENHISKMKEMKKKNNLPESNLTDMFKRMIISVNGITDKTQISAFIDNMPALDSRFLRTAYQETVPDVELSQAVECPHCGNHTEMEVPVTAEFFWPRQ